MDPRSDGCRLCLDPFAESFTTIDNPQLKDQMEKVFCFSIKPKQGHCSNVCQSCSYTISEFYQYSEKVRHNQELLNGNVSHCDPTVDSKITLESVKVETLSDSGLPEATEDLCETKDEVSRDEEGPTFDSKIRLESIKVETLSASGLLETTEEACESKDEVSGEEELPSTGDDELYEPPPKKSQTKQTRRPGKRKLNDLEADGPTKNSKQTIRKTQQEQNEDDQLFNKHFRMICDLCGTSAATFTELRSHFRIEHKRREGYVVCCNKKLFKRYAILDHIDFHANPDVFRCEECGKNYKSKDSLNVHLLWSHSSIGPFKCDLCPQAFPKKSTLTKHMELHVKVNCPKCNKMFACKKSLSYHITSQHGGKDRTMVCETCGQEFLTKQAFDRHMNEHMGIKEQRLQCGICQRWLKSERSLRDHMKWVHTVRERNFQCDICLQKYPHSRALYMHKLQTHAEPKHECEFCGRKFKKAISLKEHRTTHTGEVLYTCEHCGIPNNCMAKLYQHIKRQHPTEWAQKKQMETQSNGPS